MQTSKWSLKGVMTRGHHKRQILIARVIFYRKNHAKKILNPSKKEISKAVKDQVRAPKKIYLTLGSLKVKFLERIPRNQV